MRSINNKFTFHLLTYLQCAKETNAPITVRRVTVFTLFSQLAYLFLSLRVSVSVCLSVSTSLSLPVCMWLRG